MTPNDDRNPRPKDQSNPDQSNQSNSPDSDHGFRALPNQDALSKRRRRVAGTASDVTETEIPSEISQATSPKTSQPRGSSRQAASTSRPSPPLDRQPFTLRNADRAQRWQALPPLKTARLQQAQLLTLLAVPLIPIGLHWAWVTFAQQCVYFATVVLRLRVGFPMYHFPVPGVFAWIVSGFGLNASIGWLLPLAQGLDLLLLAGLTFLAAPYVLDWVMRQFYGMQPFTSARLAQISPESQRRLQALCQQQKISLPQLGLVPTLAPIALTYGTFPKTARIVISQGLLDQLDDAELAAVYSAEASHMSLLNMGVLSWVMLTLQVPYVIYWWTAQVGDYAADWAEQQENRILEILGVIGQYAIAGLSSVAYCSFWFLRWAGLWLSRSRSIYADHAATNVTGNPNAQARAILKMARGISQTIQTQGQTDFLLEGWELLMPVGYRSALSLGSLLNVMSAERALEWDLNNPQRRILTLNNSHALMGDRLARLMRYAQAWNLAPELEFTSASSPKTLSWGQLLWAGSPFWGAVIGYGVAMLLWAIAWLTFYFNLPQLSWLGSDFKLFYVLPLWGFGIATLLRFNSYFPDLPAAWQRRGEESSVSLAEVVQDSLAIPTRSRPTMLTGKLLGRKGVSNWLGQDLLLQTDEGLVRLHYTSGLGIPGNWILADRRPCNWVGQGVTVAGWLRRGATPWFDLEILRHSSGRAMRGGHQIWATVVGSFAMLLGLIWLGTIEDMSSLIRKLQKPSFKKP